MGGGVCIPSLIDTHGRGPNLGPAEQPPVDREAHRRPFRRRLNQPSFDRLALVSKIDQLVGGIREFMKPAAAIAGVLCLVQLAALTGCGDHRIHDHVVMKGKPAIPGSGFTDWLEKFSTQAAQPANSRPHVLLISLDTLRADHLGAWGYDRPTSPFLDELARHGVRFDQAFSHSPKTAPSHMSVFTGAFPSDHGAHLEYKFPGGRPIVFPSKRDVITLAEILQGAGYRTAAWTGGGQVTRSAGFARGFDRFLENTAQINPSKMQPIRTWFRRNSTKPCFIFVHTYQIHDPYLPPPPYNDAFTAEDYRGWVIGDRVKLTETVEGADYFSIAAAFWKKTGRKPDPSIIGPDDRQHLIDLYDGGIRYTDDVLRGFFEDLASDGLLENTLVIVFADHGEEFLEHRGVLHEKLYQETLHVPLIFFWPQDIPSGSVVEAQVPLMDLTPTVLELVGLDPPPTNARSLVSFFDGSDRLEPRAVFSEEPWVHPAHHRSFRNGFTTVYDHGNGQVELFNASADPREVLDLAAERPEQAIGLIEEMTVFLAARNAPDRGTLEAARELTEDEVEALRALGYVE